VGPVDATVERAIAAIDRADFVNGFFVRRGPGWSWVAVDVRPLPEEPAALVYSNTPLVTAIGRNGMPRSPSTKLCRRQDSVNAFDHTVPLTLSMVQGPVSGLGQQVTAVVGSRALDEAIALKAVEGRIECPWR
jgi:hypothetical protein